MPYENRDDDQALCECGATYRRLHNESDQDWQAFLDSHLVEAHLESNPAGGASGRA
jgi:hypothetical protein